MIPALRAEGLTLEMAEALCGAPPEGTNATLGSKPFSQTVEMRGSYTSPNVTALDPQICQS